MKKITVINYTGMESNWGCKVTSKHLLLQLSANNPETIERINLEVPHTLYRRCIGKLRTLLGPLLIKTHLITKLLHVFELLHSIERKNLDKIRRSDLIVLNGEGSLHGYTSELIKFIQYLAFAKKLGKPVFIVNHSLDFDDPSLQSFFSQLYFYSDKNIVREPMSLNNIERLNYGVAAELVHDAAFMQEVNHRVFTPLDDQTDFILASGSVILDSDPDQYLEFLEEVSKRLGSKLIFIASCPVDKRLKGLVTEKYGFDFFDDVELNFEQAHKMIFDSLLFISGRFHMNVLAATAGRIFVPFRSNTCKIEGLVKSLSYPMEALDVRNINIEKTIREINSLLKSRASLEDELLKKTTEFREIISSRYRGMVGGITSS